MDSDLSDVPICHPDQQFLVHGEIDSVDLGLCLDGESVGIGSIINIGINQHSHSIGANSKGVKRRSNTNTGDKNLFILMHESGRTFVRDAEEVKARVQAIGQHKLTGGIKGSDGSGGISKLGYIINIFNTGDSFLPEPQANFLVEAVPINLHRAIKMSYNDLFSCHIHCIGIRISFYHSLYNIITDAFIIPVDYVGEISMSVHNEYIGIRIIGNLPQRII
jgi:hypothetical protein